MPTKPAAKQQRKRRSPKLDLREAFSHMQQGLLHDLGASALATHPTAKGDNSELNWLGMLNAFLPLRYRSDRAFVVDVNGKVSLQIDIVVYDRQYSPLLFQHGGGLYVPAESVYAVFEVKPTVSKANLTEAAEKVASVRDLHRTRGRFAHLGGTDSSDWKHIIGGLLASSSSWREPFGPPFAKAMKSLPHAGRLDFGVGLRHGAFERDEPSGLVTIEEGEKALLFFALRFFQRLQLTGTVGALDIAKWSAAAGL